MNIFANLNRIRTEIKNACAKAGRPENSVKLLAVTKTVGIPEIMELSANGQTLFGENRPQALRDKMRAIPPEAGKWHFIGPLQKNKIKYVYPFVEMVHSVDTLELVDAFGDWFRKTGKKCPCLLEVNISGEKNKHGFPPDEVLRVIDDLRKRDDLDIRGLMGMAPFVEDTEIIRKSFRTLSQLFKESISLSGPAFRAEELSMGMTDDFLIAIEEGATIVRIGRALFEDR